MQLKRNPYGYAPKPSGNGQLPFVVKLSPLDRKHMRQWRAFGFSIATIARAYDITYGYAALIVSGKKHK